MGIQNQRNIAFLPTVVLLLNVNNTQKHILFTFLILYHFSAACNNIDQNVGQLCNHKYGEDFSIH